MVWFLSCFLYDLLTTIIVFCSVQITDLPPGRIPVETYALEGNENGFENVYQVMMLSYSTFNSWL